MNNHISRAIKDIQTHLSMLNEGILSEKECLENIYQAAEDGLFSHTANVAKTQFAIGREIDPSEMPCDGSCTDDPDDTNGEALLGIMCSYCVSKLPNLDVLNVRGKNGV
jgi:hypothetical protein